MTEEDLACGPRLASKPDDRLQHRRSVLRPVDAASLQAAQHHRLAAEHLQQQVAVRVAAAVELPGLLLTVAAPPGVHLEHQSRRRASSRLGVAALAGAHGRLLHPIVAQPGAIIPVLAAATKPAHALRRQPVD